MLGAPVAGHLEDCDAVQYIDATQAALKLQEQNAYMRRVCRQATARIAWQVSCRRHDENTPSAQLPAS